MKPNVDVRRIVTNAVAIGLVGLVAACGGGMSSRVAKVAEAEGIKVEDDDLEAEVEAMAERSGENIRRVRARVEKEGLADALATQILERRALDHILKSVQYEDVAADEPEVAVETLDEAASPAPEAGEADEAAAAE